MAPTAWDHFIARARRLYQQARVEAQVPSRIGAYVKRWLPWMRGGLGLLGPGCAFFRHRRAQSGHDLRKLGQCFALFGHKRAQTQKQMADLSSGQAIKTIKIRKLHALDIWPILHFSR